MGLSEEIRQQLINSFKAEQSEHVQSINQGLLALEKNPPDEEERQHLLNEIFREAHSLKGAARAVGMTAIESLGHALEDLLLEAKEGRLSFSAELFDLLYQALDAVELVMERAEAGDTAMPAEVLNLLTRLEAAKPTGEGEREETAPVAEPVGQAAEAEADRPEAPAPAGPRPQADETIRVSVGKLDALMNQFSELLGAKIRAEQRLAEVREMQTFAAEWHKEWMVMRNHYNRLVRHNGSGHNGHTKEVEALIQFAAANQEQLRDFQVRSNSLYRQLSNDTMRFSLAINELQEEIKRVRMLPLSTITSTFGRMVRDLAREQEKQITLTIIGGDTELDKRVLEQIKDPLIHLLRNAVDHGLEPPVAREAAGKPAEGQILLSASQQGQNVVISVSDDGQGLDLATIRQVAVQRGLLNPIEVQKLPDDEAANLIFNSGLSTSQIITDISGRGVGLDVVRQNVEELHGILEVDTKPGRGTTFTLTLPLTLASSHGLLVRAGDQTFALPLTTVERMLHIERQEIASVEGREAITYQDKPVAVVWLSDVLELPPARQPLAADNKLTVVIVAVADRRLGLIVDGLAGEQEIVMKGLGKQLARVGGIAGATVLGSGEVILVLHTADLIKLAGRSRSRSSTERTVSSEQRETTDRTSILVVDDSITTRTLEKNILESAGYRVQLATDGEEALAALVGGNLPDLVISDINMPRLDGFALTERIKQDSRYADIPVILVTSLDSPADKAHGIEVGADAYIVKSSFDQSNLLETIEQLV